ncbi:MAG: PaaI family thioesterase [Desulforegulaceae bacterium]|nr:PaaI family thioesterase [Desulforegulaceae bacterium]
MNKKKHFRMLESMYKKAPINEFFNPEIFVNEGKAEIKIKVDKKFFHTGNSVHGSVFFKMLDDGAYFAASSLEYKHFLVTTSFTTYMTRPVSSGFLKVYGRVVNKNKTQYISEAVLYDSDNNEIARGNGIFVKSKLLIESALNPEL